MSFLWNAWVRRDLQHFFNLALQTMDSSLTQSCFTQLYFYDNFAFVSETSAKLSKYNFMKHDCV